MLCTLANSPGYSIDDNSNNNNDSFQKGKTYMKPNASVENMFSFACL